MDRDGPALFDSLREWLDALGETLAPRPRRPLVLVVRPDPRAQRGRPPRPSGGIYRPLRGGGIYRPLRG